MTKNSNICDLINVISFTKMENGSSYLLLQNDLHPNLMTSNDTIFCVITVYGLGGWDAWVLLRVSSCVAVSWG